VLRRLFMSGIKALSALVSSSHNSKMLSQKPEQQKTPEPRKPVVKVAVDVNYRDHDATAAMVAFSGWTDAKAEKVYHTNVSPIQPYEPGQFYKRELPCILQVLKMVQADYQVDTIIVDGYVTLEPGHPGLGQKLYEALGGAIPVIGVAKTSFKGADAEQVLRGQSKTPLYVTSAGIDRYSAADFIRYMHGEFRLPTMLKLVDTTCRNPK